MGGKPFLNDLEQKQHYTMSRSYALSRLYIIWIMRHFVKEVQQTGIGNITFNTIYPASAPPGLGSGCGYILYQCKVAGTFLSRLRLGAHNEINLLHLVSAK
jgi:hypothetical protein